MLTHNLALFAIAAFAWCVSAELSHVSSSSASTAAAAHTNSTASGRGPVLSGDGQGLQPGHNATDSAVGSRISTLMTYLPSLKKGVFFVCVMTAALVVCLLVKVVRSGRRIRKTRKYDIITTPGERVEMAPLNQDAEEDDDSTLFDVKYRSDTGEVWTGSEMFTLLGSCPWPRLRCCREALKLEMHRYHFFENRYKYEYKHFCTC